MAKQHASRTRLRSRCLSNSSTLTCSSRSFLISGHSYFSLSFCSVLNTTLGVTSLSLCNVTLKFEHLLSAMLPRVGAGSSALAKGQGLDARATGFTCTRDRVRIVKNTRDGWECAATFSQCSAYIGTIELNKSSGCSKRMKCCLH